MLTRRLISAAVIISLMILILYADFWLGRTSQLARPGLVLAALALLTGFLASNELVEMFSNAASRVNSKAVVLATLAMVAVTVTPAWWISYPADCVLGRFGFAFSGIVVGLVILLTFEMATYGGDRDTPGSAKGEIVDRLGRSAFCLIYVSTLISFLFVHRYLGGDNATGLLTIVTLITTTKLSDAAAYFTGKSFGTIKMAPKLSPGKTIQGSIGGLFGGCAGAAIVVYLVGPFMFGVSVDKPWWWVVLYGLLVAAAGMFGDLAESLIKRDTNTKDSSRWLPGLGGILDVIDSLVFAAPVSFLLWI